jgi:SAM-dependent methyltransferase
VQISRSGRVTVKKRANTANSAPKKKQTHNREKNYILKQGIPIEPLVDMGIFSRDGKVINAMYDKYRQINRFVEIVDDEVGKSVRKKLKILDIGCGKSYFTFVLYYYLTEINKIDTTIIGLDLKDEVIEKCNIAARKYGYDKLHFKVGDISNFEHQGDIDMVVSLHACDTATDHVLYNAICWDVDMIFAVPCCQHEINSQIRSDSFAILTRFGIAKERFSSLLTDVIRCNLLEYSGYRTQMLEFVDLEHTAKNVMIRAVKKAGSGRNNSKKTALLAEDDVIETENNVSEIEKNMTENEVIVAENEVIVAGNKMAEVEKLMEEFNISPTLYNLLKSHSQPN